MDALMPLLRFPGVRVKPWNDKEIRPGIRWDKEIKDALADMDVFIPVVSVNFAAKPSARDCPSGGGSSSGADRDASCRRRALRRRDVARPRPQRVRARA